MPPVSRLRLDKDEPKYVTTANRDLEIYPNSEYILVLNGAADTLGKIMFHLLPEYGLRL